MKQFNGLNKLFAGALISAGLLTNVTIADDRYNDRSSHGYEGQVHYHQSKPVHIYDPHDQNFRNNHQFKVFIEIEAGKKGRAEKLEYLTIETIADNLPYGVQLVRDPHYADLVIRARERDYDVNFRITDVDRKNKKYKKRFRYNAGYSNGCGGLYRAHYRKVEERGTGYYDYGISIRMKGYGRDRINISGRVREKYSYGTDLKAQTTGCGLQPTNIYPSGKVARLFERAHPSYRRDVRRELRREAACDLGLKIAYTIKGKANHYYEDLANRYNRQNYENSGYSEYDDPYYGNKKGHHKRR